MAAQTTKAEEAYRNIRKMIIKGFFSHKAKWSLRRLAERFNMSVVPVSEAIRRLEQDGLLETRMKKGVWLKTVSKSYLDEMAVLREAYEVQAVRMVALHPQKKHLDKLKKLGKEIKILLEKRAYEEAAYLDYEFHIELVKGSQCGLLIDKYEQVAVMLQVCTGEDNSYWERAESIKDHGHLDIVAVLKSGSCDCAEETIRRHIKGFVN